MQPYLKYNKMEVRKIAKFKPINKCHSTIIINIISPEINPLSDVSPTQYLGLKLSKRNTLAGNYFENLTKEASLFSDNCLL